MIIKNVSSLDLTTALDKLNEQYENNVIFNTFTRLGETRFSVTLRVKDSKKKGHRLGFYKHPKTQRRRRLINACWHVHGDFFDILLKINKEAIIKTALTTITQNGGNWTDRRIGSMVDPLMYSEACECSIKQNYS